MHCTHTHSSGGRRHDLNAPPRSGSCKIQAMAVSAWSYCESGQMVNCLDSYDGNLVTMSAMGTLPSWPVCEAWPRPGPGLVSCPAKEVLIRARLADTRRSTGNWQDKGRNHDRERILLHHQTQTFSPYIKDGRREQMILSYFYVNDVVSWDHVRGNNDFFGKV